MQNSKIIIHQKEGKGNTSDPYIILYDGYYYHCYDGKDGVYVARSKELEKISEGPCRKVYDYLTEGNLKAWFAPELHYLDGKWYIYGAPEDQAGSHRMAALVCETENPMDAYCYAGFVEGIDQEWCIDGTILEYEKERYFIWTTCGEIFIGRMSDPLHVCGTHTGITVPEYDWEQQMNPVVEGPAVLKHKDKIYLIYSASDSKCDDYCLGCMIFQGGNPLDKKNWMKYPKPLLTKRTGMYGPGHCSFTSVGADEYVIFHANEVSGSGWHGRSAWMQKIEWDADFPVFQN